MGLRVALPGDLVIVSIPQIAWDAMAVDIAHEDENYRVVVARSPQESAVSLVKFDHWTGVQDPVVPVPFADVRPWNLATKIGYNLIHVQTRRNDWYQLEGIDDALNAVRALKRDGDFFLSYGGSMGGYAAVAFADDVAADLFLAVSPQASISRAYMMEINDNRWRNCWPQFTRDRVIGQPRKACRGVVIFDPDHKTDAAHAHAVARHADTHLLVFPGSWHSPIAAARNGMGGWRIFADWLIHAARNQHDVADACADLQALIDRTLLARFAKAPTDVRMAMIAQEGVETIRAQVSIEYVCNVVSATPDAAEAFIIYQLAAGSRDRDGVTYAARALQKWGFADYASELQRQAEGLP
jgi:hypothetical protein